MKMKEEYYITNDDRLYIRQVYSDRTWGWYFWYDKRFRMCVRDPVEKGLKQVSKEEFYSLYFIERL